MLRQTVRQKIGGLVGVILILFAATITVRAALPIFPTGDANIVLGDPLKRITGSFPALESMCGTDQNGVFIEAYLLNEPDFIEAKEIWFILDHHKLVQVDYIFTDSQFEQLDKLSPVRSRMDKYFGAAGRSGTVGGEYEDSTSRLLWNDDETGENASLDFLKRGGVRVSFFSRTHECPVITTTTSAG
jgi:hypothetical protein